MWSLSFWSGQFVLSSSLSVSPIPTLRIRPRMRSPWWRWNHYIASLSHELLLRLSTRSRMRMGPSLHSLTADWASLIRAVSSWLLLLIAKSKLVCMRRREMPLTIFISCLMVSCGHGSSRAIGAPVMILHVMTSCFCWWMMLHDCPAVVGVLWNWHIIKYINYKDINQLKLNFL